MRSFKSIDPTPCHQSAHPKEHEGSVSFTIRDSEADSDNTVSVSEITTRHFRRLKNSASDFLGKQANAAVITVPTNFSDKQREALKKAAEAGGLEVLQLIHEPVADVLAYDARPDAKLGDKNVLVVDVGGTRSDVAVIASRGGMYTILATAHDYDVSGAQLDQVLIDYFAKEFLKKHKGVEDPRENPRSMAKLRLESEAVKKALSLGQSASFSVESLSGGLDFTATINRSRYELLASKLLQSLKRLVVHVVEKAELDVLDINEIICAGGNSHTPKLSRTLADEFPQTTIVLAPALSPTAINPSELAARGAAIQASLVEMFDADDIEQSTHPVVTATPHLAYAVGVLSISPDEKGAGVFTLLIEPETPVPVRRAAHVAVPKAGGDVLVKLCEGVREIKVTKPGPKPKTNGAKEDDDDSEDDDSEDEDEELREKVWKAGRVLAEMAVRGTTKGSKVEVQVNVGAELDVQVIAREVNGKGGTRGMLEKPAIAQNGSV